MNLILRHEKKLNDARKGEMFTRTTTTGCLTIPAQEKSCNVFSSLVTGFNLPLQPSDPSQLLAPGELRQKDFLCLDGAKLSLQKPYCRNKAPRLNDSSLIDVDIEKLGKVYDDDTRQNCSSDDVASRDAMGAVGNHRLDSERPALTVNNTGTHQAAGSLKDNMHPSVSIHGHVNKSCTSSSLNSTFPLERISIFTNRTSHQDIEMREDGVKLLIMCKICYMDNVNHVLFPCGDTMCARCAAKIFRSGLNCTICGQMVSTFYTIYM